MSEFLSKIGQSSYLHPWRVISVWIALLAVLGGLAYVYIQPTDASISIPGTESQQAIDRAGELFPDTGTASGRIVLKSSDGKPLMSHGDKIDSLIADVSKVEGVSTVVGPSQMPDMISKSGDIGFIQVQLENSASETDSAVFEKIDEIVAGARSEELQVEKSMSLSNMAPEDILGVGEIVGVAVAFVVLLITLGSLVAAGMPILSALIGVGVSMAGLFAMSELITIGSTTPVLAIMLGLAVGIDYALFIVNRYQNLLRSGRSYEDAIKSSIGTAGNAVVFAALTVVVALAALSVVQIPFMTTMGLVGAASVAVAATSAITFIPALLGLARGRIFKSVELKQVETLQGKSKKQSEKIDKDSIWFKWVSIVTKYPGRALIASLVLTGLLAYPVLDMKLGLPTDQYAAEESTYKKAYNLLEEGFGVGFNGPLLVVVEGLDPVDTKDVSVDPSKISEMLQMNNQASPTPGVPSGAPSMMQQSPGVNGADAPVMTPEALEEYQKQAMALTQQQAKFAAVGEVSQKLLTVDGVDQAVPVGVSDDGKAGIVQVIPSHSPSSEETADLIDELRDNNIVSDLGLNEEVSLAVTGTTALEIDVSEKLSEALPIYLAVVVGISLVLLVLAFRSIVVPIKATLGFLASVLVMFGSVVAVFQWGWFGITDAPGPIVSFIPIIAIGILFGLAMDYEFFLVSSMREKYAESKKSKESIISGFAVSGRVVAAAAIIMVSVFAGFVSNHDTTIQAMGFGLAVGIFFDAFVVRMVMVPAVMTLVGDKTWWIPKWLDKYLPHVSVEGKK